MWVFATRVRMASEMGWGGIPLMRPSSLATRYQLYEKDIIPERRIEPGQRYRARKNLVEHVSPSASLAFPPELLHCTAARLLVQRIMVQRAIPQSCSVSLLSAVSLFWEK